MIDDSETNRRRRLGRLLHATADSPYLPMIAQEAGLDAALAKKILASTAQNLLPVEKPATAPVKPVAVGSLAPRKLVVNTDGASRGNPGPSGAGAYLTNPDGSVVGAHKKYLGHGTNNVAEYQAVILGLEAAAKAGATEVELRADSELVVRQLSGIYKIKDPTLGDLARIAKAKEKRFARVTYRHVPREQNVVADRLSNEAIDEHE